MKKAYLHIGVEKTGTTSIQSFMAENRAALRQEGYLYPSTPGKVNHVGMAIIATDNPNHLAGLLPLVGLTEDADVGAYSKQMLLDFAAEARNSNCHTLVLSNEHLSSRIRTPKAITLVRDALRGIADEVDVIVYLRRQDDAVLSEYSTRVKAGYAEGFTLKRTHFVKYSYTGLLDRWASVFGHEQILVRVFDKTAFKGGDLIADFMHAIRCPETDAFSRVAPQNVSLDAACLEYLRRLNRHLPAAVDGRRNKERGSIVAELTAISKGEKPRLSSAEAEEILKKFEDSNRDVAVRYLHKADGQLFAPIPKQSVSNNLEAFDEDAAFRISSALWCRIRGGR